MEIIGDTGFHSRPWPELMPDGRPALVVPAAPDRPVLPGEGWAGRADAPELADEPHPGWSATLTGYQLTVHRPGDDGGGRWFDGHIDADRHWRRRIRDRRTLLLITGPFSSVFDFHPAAASGLLSLLTVPVRLLGDL